MKYVIDASVGFKWAVSEIDSDKATRLRDDFNSAIDELLAPDLFPTEIANALAIAERTGRIKLVNRPSYTPGGNGRDENGSAKRANQAAQARNSLIVVTEI